MKLRAQAVVLFVTLTTVAAVAAGWGSYRLASQEQYRTVEIALVERTARVERLLMDLDDPTFGRPPAGTDGGGAPSIPAPPPGGQIPPPLLALINDVSGGDVIVRVIDSPDGGDEASGRALAIELLNERAKDVVLPDADLVASGTRMHRLRVDGVSYLVCVSMLDGGGAVLAARSLAEADSTLRGVRQRMIIVLLPVIILSGLLGWLGARRLARPLESLAASADHVRRTGELDLDFETAAPGEVGAVARSFRSMLDSLARSREQQQRLVADAGHELRTPLTAVRVNAQMLASGRLSEADARRAASAIVAETAELAALADELVELASVSADSEQRSRVDLRDIAERVAANARRRHGCDITVAGRSVAALGQEGQIERAISNLVDNAVKFAPAGLPIIIRVDSTSVAVVDQGPGIADDDLALLFLRFYRAPAARSLPGSGLGLAIVDEVARDHGGRPFARNHGHGATVGFTLQRNFDPAKRRDVRDRR